MSSANPPEANGGAAETVKAAGQVILGLATLGQTLVVQVGIDGADKLPRKGLAFCGKGLMAGLGLIYLVFVFYVYLTVLRGLHGGEGFVVDLPWWLWVAAAVLVLAVVGVGLYHDSRYHHAPEESCRSHRGDLDSVLYAALVRLEASRNLVRRLSPARVEGLTKAQIAAELKSVSDDVDTQLDGCKAQLKEAQANMKAIGQSVGLCHLYT